MNEHGLTVDHLINRLMEYEDNNPDKRGYPEVPFISLTAYLLTHCSAVSEISQSLSQIKVIDSPGLTYLQWSISDSTETITLE